MLPENEAKRVKIGGHQVVPEGGSYHGTVGSNATLRIPAKKNVYTMAVTTEPFNQSEKRNEDGGIRDERQVGNSKQTPANDCVFKNSFLAFTSEQPFMHNVSL